MKRNLLIITIILLSHILYSAPRMIPIVNEQIKLEMSETVITVGDYKEYMNQSGKGTWRDLENNIKRMIDERDYKCTEELPVWGITWLEAAEYCNWLSKKDGYKECYEFIKKEDNTIEVEINKNADGYRMPYVRELLIVSGWKDGLSKEQYEKENTNGIKHDLNHYSILQVYEGKRNRYGIYDVLGNICQYCNDYYNEEYDYFDYSLSYYGPDNYSPDLDQVFYKEPLTAVRCYFGGDFYTTYDKITKKSIYDINQISTEIAGIRLVRVADEHNK